MTSPVLSVSPHMTEKQVEDLFTRYDVRAFPVVDENNDVIGLVSYQLTMAAQQRLRNKEQKRLRQELDALEKGVSIPSFDENVVSERSKSSSVKAWMIRNVQIVEESKTLAEVEAIFLENDIGCIPVVADGTRRLVGMVTRTDLLRQHRYYPSLTYHNKGFADSIAARKPIIELRKKLKQFDLD
jgi:CBS-domain-containing membrane protein